MMKYSVTELKYNTAMLDIDAERYLGALLQLKDLHQRFPDKIKYWLPLIGSYIGLGLLYKATALIKELKENGIAEELVFLLLEIGIARAEKRAGDLETLTSRFKNADVTSLTQLVRLGDTYFTLQQWQKAIESYQQALKIDPNSVVAYFGLGKSLLQAEKPKEAIEPLEKAIELGQRWPLMFYYLGVAHSLNGEKDKSAALLEQCLDRAPYLDRARKKLIAIYNSFLNRPLEAAKHQQYIDMSSVHRANDLPE